MTELEAVAAVAIEHDLVVVTDEVYEHLTFGQPHVPLATLPGMFDRTVTISSAGKTFSLTGWKVGWASGPADLVAAVEGAKNWLSYSSGAPLQPAVAVALDRARRLPPSRSPRTCRERRDRLCSGPGGSSECGCSNRRAPTSSTTDVSAYGHVDGRAFCDALPELAGGRRDPRPRSSTTTTTRAGTSCAGRSASSARSSTRACADWPQPTSRAR